MPHPMEESIPLSLEKVVHIYRQTARVAAFVAAEHFVVVGVTDVELAAVGAPARVRAGRGCITKADGRRSIGLGDGQPARDVRGERAVG